jgi:hypothetical protein
MFNFNHSLVLSAASPKNSTTEKNMVAEKSHRTAVFMFIHVQCVLVRYGLF